jgi:hypothetical protein
LSGNSAACLHVLREWVEAITTLKILEVEREKQVTNGDADGGVFSSQSSIEKLPVGFECWLHGAVDQLNRTALHYAGMRGDAEILKLLSEIQWKDLHTNSNHDLSSSSLASGLVFDEVMSQLMSCEVLKNVGDINGFTPPQLLHVALNGAEDKDTTSIVAENESSSSSSSSSVTAVEVDGSDGSGGWSKQTFQLPPHFKTNITNHGTSKLTNGRYCDVQVIDAKDMTPKKFLLEFLSASQPVLIKGAAEDWKFRSVILHCAHIFFSQIIYTLSISFYFPFIFIFYFLLFSFFRAKLSSVLNNTAQH